jgi:Family of unknown function (DUF5309)
MSVTNALLTYGDSARKEDVVLNMVEILTAEENQLLSGLGKTKALDEVHSFLVDTLLTPASAAYQQGADYSYNALTTPTRLTNIVQEIAIPIRVSRKQQASQHYHGRNELERQLSKALMDWGNAAEFDIVRSTLVSGVSGTVAKMNGVIAAISKSTNTTVQTSGTIFSASILDGLMQNNWDNSNGDVANALYVGSILRKNIDGFTQKTNVVVNAPGISTIVRTVSTYETAFGTIAVNKHRYVQQSGDATGRVLAINKDKIKLAYLDMPIVDSELARAGAYTPKAVYGSVTVEVNNQDSNWFASGFLKA